MRHRIKKPRRGSCWSSSSAVHLLVLLLSVCCFQWSSSFAAAAGGALRRCIPIGSSTMIVNEADGSERPPPTVPVPDSWMNDGYCDCINGQDEPETGACAGMNHWPGTIKRRQGSAAAANEAPLFQCPQQPKLQLTQSKVNDGICDCCDGADEVLTSDSDCEDICDEVMAAERAARAKLETDFKEGVKKRKQAIQKFKDRQASVEQEVQEKQEQLTKTKEELRQLQEKSINFQLDVLELRLQAVQARTAALATTTTAGSSSPTMIADPGLVGMLAPLSAKELSWLIVHACQVAGEMPHAKDGKTCVPLRLAGLDAGIVWDKSYQPRRVIIDEEGTSDAKKQLAALLAHNLQSPNDLKWKPLVGARKSSSSSAGDGTSSKRGRRRLMAADDDYTYNDYHGDDDGLSEGYEEDEYDNEDDDYHKTYDDDTLRMDDDGADLDDIDRADKPGADDDYYEEKEAYDDEQEPEEEDDDNEEVDPVHEKFKKLQQLKDELKEMDEEAVAKANKVMRDAERRKAAEEKRRREQERRDRERRRRRRRSSDNEEEEDQSEEARERRAQLMRVISDQPFSAPRVAYLADADKLIGVIQSMPAEDDEEEDNNDDDAGVTAEEVAQEQEAAKVTPTVDPMAVTMVRNRLSTSSKQIRRGLDYAVSAKVLIEQSQPTTEENGEATPPQPPLSQDELLHLAVGTLNHGQLSTQHVWQIFQAIIPELRDENASSGTTCQSPWIPSCGLVRSLERPLADGTMVTVPTSTILNAGRQFCELIYSSAAAEESCDAPFPTDRELTTEDLPSSIPNGFRGYFTVEARSGTDPLGQLFNEVRLDKDAIPPAAKPSFEQLEQLKQSQEDLQNEKRNIDSEIRKLQDSVSGELGPDGELYAFKTNDDCFSVDANKYTYELCLFGSASQKDVGSSGRGTDLGKWDAKQSQEDMVDEETGRRIWKWQDGARCWNGPARSAVAYVTCGNVDGVKLLSAEEPETCKYELQAESYVACDANFRAKHGL